MEQGKAGSAIGSVWPRGEVYGARCWILDVGGFKSCWLRGAMRCGPMLDLRWGMEG